jgi:hypothetical protein
LENLSTTVRITLLLCTLGKASKSMDMSAQTCEGTERGCNNPTGCRDSDLFCWHIVQALTNSWTMRRSWST